jgi:hypothetical protein
MGTPSYMAPEQAAGRSGLVTTAADVYALGAILYECLTGRPPFKAATPLDTVLQVLEREPERPSALRPGTDRRLELVCLKCLAKEPGGRYASADALAADLERWRAGEPVSVQPPALTALLRVWLRQNFGAAGWTAVVGLAVGLVLSFLMWLAMIQPALKPLEGSYRRVAGGAPWLVAAWAAPPWLVTTLVTLGVVAVGLSGLVTARLVRPRNGQADVAAGLVSGAVAGVVFFTLGFGWFAGLVRMRPSLNQDLWWLSRAAWDEPPAARERWFQGRLLEKYPGLGGVPAGERGRVLYDKVACDLCTAVPAGIWLGMAMSVAFCLAVGVCGTAMGGHLLRRRGGAWKALVAYLEGMVPTALLCATAWVLAMPWVLGARLKLPAWYLLLLGGVLGLAVAAVLRGWRWWARLPLHASWIALEVASRLFDSR